MATTESIVLEGFSRSPSKGRWSALKSTARRKPLGFACGIIVIIFLIIGDLVPEVTNKALSTAGLGTPVPYVADLLEKHTSFVHHYQDQDLRSRLASPSSEYLLGTDALGRDIFSRLLYGARTAVVVSLGAVVISEFIALLIGLTAGYYRGFADKVLYRFVDIFQALPGLVVLITVLGIMGSGLWQLVIVIGIIGGPGESRLVRAQTISTMALPFVESARVVGAGDTRLMLRHVLPNVLPIIILGATLRLGTVVLIEASLSFLGYGLPPPFPSWGQMLSLDGREFMQAQPGLAIFPGLAIGLLVFSFNLFGDALRDLMDPRLRGR